MQRMQAELLTNVRKRDAVVQRVEMAESEEAELDLALAPGATGGSARRA
jgi:hypothetical protein